MGPRWIVVTDIDGTLVGDDAGLARFADWFGRNRQHIVLAYATGRTLDGVRQLFDGSPAPRPDVAITAVGTEVHDADGRPWPGWEDRFGSWDAGLVRRALLGEPRLTQQPEEFQSRRKASFFGDRLSTSDLDRFAARLAALGLATSMIYSGERYLDFLPPGAGKGSAARAVAASLGIPPERVLVFGDTGNDADLFQQGFRGTLVANALPELAAAADGAYRSPFAYADGILDGIRHWAAATT